MPTDKQNRSVKRLIELGKGKGYLLRDEIHEMLADDVLGVPNGLAENLREVGIDVIDRPERYQNQVALEAVRGEFEATELEVAQDTFPELEKSKDPVRMYLREMSRVPLLDRHGELDIARSLEHGEWLIHEALCEHPLLLRELLRLHELTQMHKRVLRELIDSEPDEARGSRVSERINKNLEIFRQIGKYDREMHKLRNRQKRYRANGERYRGPRMGPRRGQGRQHQAAPR